MATLDPPALRMYSVDSITGCGAYRRTLKMILNEVPESNSMPRDLPIRDLGMLTIMLRNPATALPDFPERNLNKRIAYTEALQLVGGFADEAMVKWASPSLAKMVLDATGFQHGNYGRRINVQMNDVVAKMTNDFETRQAHVTLWNPHDDNLTGQIDYPCTSSITFRGRYTARQRFIDMTVFMRSNDAWLGLPYDLFQFAQLQLTLCDMMNARAGVYRHIANSMHIYERDVPAVEWFINATTFKDELTIYHQTSGFAPQAYNTADPARWRHVYRHIRHIIYSDSLPRAQDRHGAINEMFQSYRDWSEGK